MIFAPKMSEIILEFESFELEPDPSPPTGVFCRYDRIEIWDGFPGGKQQLQQWSVNSVLCITCHVSKNRDYRKKES